ncbi:hypothetical protein Pelo_16388 [Pelomyxa schiedti]|nr:hypothetical protein Pelo_16388 [Pelomyxa schiedti]
MCRLILVLLGSGTGPRNWEKKLSSLAFQSEYSHDAGKKMETIFDMEAKLSHFIRFVLLNLVNTGGIM